MAIKDQLKPYYNRLRAAYFIKIGLFVFGISLIAINALLLLSKFTRVHSLNNYLLLILILGFVSSIIAYFWSKPSVRQMNKSIDALGFENRVVTYCDYQQTGNPFIPYLKDDLSKKLEAEALYKNISYAPPVYLLLMMLVLVISSGVLTVWETEQSIKNDKIDQAVEVIEEEEVALLESIEKIETINENELGSLTKERLEALKEALRDDNNALAEQELFKTKELLQEALKEDDLPEAISEQLEAMADVIEPSQQQSLMTALSQGSLQEGQLSESSENAQVEPGDLGESSNSTGEPSSNDNPSQEGTNKSEGSQESGNGT